MTIKAKGGVVTVAGDQAGWFAPTGKYSLIGRAITRREDPALLTGRGRYVDDVAPAGTLHAFVVRSPVAHARIVSVDVTAALEAPAVCGAFRRSLTAGGGAAAVGTAAYRVGQRMASQRLAPVALEPRGVLACPGEDGRLEVRLPTQRPHGARNWLARILGLPPERLRVVV